MAAMIPEAVEAGEGAVESGATKAGEGGATKAGEGAVKGGPATGPAKAGRPPRPPMPRRGTAKARKGTPPRGGQQRQQGFKRSAKRASRGALKARLPGTHSYQPVILAEFLMAMVVVTIGPVASGGTPAAQAKNSPSPYSVGTIKQLVAIGGVYFVLALLASSRRAGRFAAWFGALVLLGLGFTGLANGDLQAVFHIFKPPAAGDTTPVQGTVSGSPGPSGTVVTSYVTSTAPVVTTDTGTSLA
jgi:hypothetical protein